MLNVFVEQKLFRRAKTAFLSLCTDESHRRNQELLPGCDRGESDTTLHSGQPVPTLYVNHICALLFFISFLPVCSHTHLFWCQTSWLSITVGELADRSPHKYSCQCWLLVVTHFYKHFPHRLAGGLPPYASVYPTWVDCWRHLSREVNRPLTTWITLDNTVSPPWKNADLLPLL